MRIKIFLIVIFTCISIINLFAENINIKYKVEDEIITNIDIEDEINYLLSLNNNLNNLSKEDINKIAINSIIKEKIKYIEISNFFNLSIKDKELENLIFQNLYSNLQLENKKQLEKYFLKYNLYLDDIVSKFKIEFLWNKIIYEKYFSKVIIDKKKLKIKIKSDILKKDQIEEFLLSEILFRLDSLENMQEKYDKILNTIQQRGFANAANLYSFSENNKYGGKIGWVKKTQLSNIIYNEIKNLNQYEISKPIQTVNGFLILKIEDKRKINDEIDENLEFEKLIAKETNKQLNNFSTIFFNKIKKNTLINEL